MSNDYDDNKKSALASPTREIKKCTATKKKGSKNNPERNFPRTLRNEKKKNFYHNF